jgi:hypothetical protein
MRAYRRVQEACTTVEIAVVALATGSWQLMGLLPSPMRTLSVIPCFRKTPSSKQVQLAEDQSDQRQAYDRERPWVVSTRNAADVNSKQSGQQSERQKYCGNYRQEKHDLIHGLRTLVHELIVDDLRSIAYGIQILAETRHTIGSLSQPASVSTGQPVQILYFKSAGLQLKTSGRGRPRKQPSLAVWRLLKRIGEVPADEVCHL